MARKTYQWVAGWSAVSLVGALVGLSGGHDVAAAAYLAVALIDAITGIVLLPRTRVWWAMDRRGARRIAWSWGAIAAVHWSVATVFILGSEGIGSLFVLAAGLPAFLTAGTGLANARYMDLIADALGPDERPLVFCSGGVGEPPRNVVLAATDRRVVAFVQPGMRTEMEQFASVARSDIVDVELRLGEDVHVTVRTRERELELARTTQKMAERFVREVAPA